MKLTARATKAAGAYIYIYDREAERLVLRAATEGWQRRHVDKIRLHMGEGVTGWSALMRQPVLLGHDPAADPRFRSFPELRESEFKSMVAVPILVPGEEVLGVFTLYAPAEDAFRDSDVSLATEVGSLLASGLVQAQTLTKLQVQSAAARFLHNLPDEAWGSLEQCLRAMAAECVANLDAELCTLEVATDRTSAQGWIHVVAASDRFAQEHGDVISSGERNKTALTQMLAPLSLSRLRIPLGAPAPIGAVTVYRAYRFTSEDEVLLEAIGAQVAAASLALIGAEKLRPARDRILGAPDPETTEQLLLGLGWKRRATTPVVLRLIGADASREVLGELDSSRDEIVTWLSVPGRRVELLGDGTHYLALIETPDVASRAAVVERLDKLDIRRGAGIAAGVGPLAGSLPEMHRAIRQAALAAQWASLAAPAESTVVTFEDVAHLCLLPGAALAMSPSLRALLTMLSPVIRYDLDNGTDLAVTLEAFFTHSGSVARASEALFIHRNTLRQRLQRIVELIGQSPEDFDDWVSAGLAARLTRLSRTELGEESPRADDHGPCPQGVVTIGRSCCGCTSACVLTRVSRS